MRSGDSAAVKRNRPSQFTLRSLLAIVSLTAVILAAVGGSGLT